MKMNIDKHIEQLVAKAMEDISIESPSMDFTAGVMNQIKEHQLKSATTYQPLISKPIWLLIFGSILTLIIYLILKGDSTSKSWIDSLNLGMVTSNIDAIRFPKFSFSKITVYAILLLTLMFYIQIPLIKNHLDKRF